MNGLPLRRVLLSGSPRHVGSEHGRVFADEIRAYVEDRLALSAEGTNLSRADLLALGEACLPAHEAYDAELAEEMYAMADAAGISPAEAVIVGGYTDFLDLVRTVADAPIEDNCTAVLIPDSISDGAGFLAQTWDMEASATPRVIMLQVEVDSAPSAMVFTTLGCLGQIGMNEHGLAVGINNLSAADGKAGVTWPFVVRRALRCTNAADALDAILSADLAGGHNYLVMDATGAGFSVEAMPTTHDVVTLGNEVVAHTNHCLAPTSISVEAERPAPLSASSALRLEHAPELLTTSPVTLATIEAMLRDERSICRRVVPGYPYESCGAMVMRPHTRDLWACWGIPADNDFEHFEVKERV